MKLLSDLGVPQGVLPPQERPDIETLRRLGFYGTDEEVVEQAFKTSPELASACYSASSAWAANLATATPSSDTAYGRVHFTPANLSSQFHRSLETKGSLMNLFALFPHPESFVHHDPLPSPIGDEGSANAIRLTSTARLFVYGGRQSLEAHQANVRLHRIDLRTVVYAEQNPKAISAGVFHNDLIAVGNENVLLYHEEAWVNTPQVIDELQERSDIYPIMISKEALSFNDLVETYLFNSQLVTLGNGEMALIAPKEATKAQTVIDQILEGNNPITKALYFDLSESMKNGGGPACLRLEVPITQSETEAMNQHAILNDTLYHNLVDWVNDHYRDELLLEDLLDPHLIQESRSALDELTVLLDLGPLYPFQQG